MYLGLVMAKALNYRKPSVWINKIKSICGEDIQYECVSGEVLSDNGDWYLFLKDPKWKEHYDELRKCSYVNYIICNGNEPYLFSNSEIKQFMGGIKTKQEEHSELEPGDAVKVKRGYLENLYGIVESVRKKRAKVFFAFYIRGFTESLKLSDLQFVKKTAFIPSTGKRQVTMGAKVVFTNNICR